MTNVRRRLAHQAARAARRLGGSDLGGAWSLPEDCDPATRAVIERVQPYTLTPPVRLMALCDAVRHVVRADVPGAIVECGVWRGGSMMAAALTLLELGAERDLWLYDTFSAMPAPGEHDAHVSGGDLHGAVERANSDPVYEVHDEDRVAAALAATGYARERVRLVKGMVEETLPAQAPDAIALCRLDTDYHASTRHELTHLFPRVSDGGIVIIDDYGEFLGARKAVDDYLATLPTPPLLHRVDASCRTLEVRASRGAASSPRR